MKITLDIPDRLYRRLKACAVREGSSAEELILRGVGHVLKRNLRGGQKKIKLPVVRSKRPGKVQLDNAKIYEVISFP